MSFLAQAGLALFGGLVNKATAPKPEYVAPDYQQIRDKAEKAGFNPLTALTQGPQGSVVQSANYMGSAISDAALMLAENYSASSKAAKVAALQASNQKLRKAVENMTLRPKVGGIYSQQKSGGSNAASSASSDNLGDTYLGDFLRPTGFHFGVNAPKKAVLTSAASDEKTLPSRSPIYTPFGSVYPSRQSSDAEVAEARYGELGGEVQGITSFISDIGWNLGRVVKNWSTDPKYRIDVDQTWGWGSPAMRRTNNRTAARFGYLGAGARNQHY